MTVPLPYSAQKKIKTNGPFYDAIDNVFESTCVYQPIQTK